jgi:hypothetical protein
LIERLPQSLDLGLLPEIFSLRRMLEGETDLSSLGNAFRRVKKGSISRTGWLPGRTLIF